MGICWGGRDRLITRCGGFGGLRGAIWSGRLVGWSVGMGRGPDDSRRSMGDVRGATRGCHVASGVAHQTFAPKLADPIRVGIMVHECYFMPASLVCMQAIYLLTKQNFIGNPNIGTSTRYRWNNLLLIIISCYRIRDFGRIGIMP